MIQHINIQPIRKLVGMKAYWSILLCLSGMLLIGAASPSTEARTASVATTMNAHDVADLRLSTETIDHTQAISPTIILKAPSEPQSASGIIDVELAIQNANNLSAFELELIYDRSLVQVTGITLRDFLGKTVSCNADVEHCSTILGPLDTDSGTSIGAYSYGKGSDASGDGVLAIVHLAPTGAGGAEGAEGTVSLEVASPLITGADTNPTVPATQGTTLKITVSGQTASHSIYLPIVSK